jgi:phage terminase small subunit
VRDSTGDGERLQRKQRAKCRAADSRRKRKGVESQVSLGALTASQAEFVLEYEANGRNATSAYLKCHPGCRSRAAAAVEGSRTLRNPNVVRVLERIRAERATRLAMAADEAAALLAICARADIRAAYDHNGRRLPVHEWPDELAGAVKVVKADGTIVLHDGLKARITILQMHGRLRPTQLESQFDHVAYLAALSRRR